MPSRARQRPKFLYSERPVVLKIIAINSILFLLFAGLAFPMGWKSATAEMMVFGLLYVPILAVLLYSRKIEFYEDFMITGSLHEGIKKIPYREIEYCRPIYPRKLFGEIVSFESIDGIELKLSDRKELVTVRTNPINEETQTSLYDWMRQKIMPATIPTIQK